MPSLKPSSHDTAGRALRRRATAGSGRATSPCLSAAIRPTKDLQPVSDERFGPEHRLRKRREFLRTYDKGFRANGRIAVIFCLPQHTLDANPTGDAPTAVEPWRLGMAATRRLGKAVVRNRLRRRVREFFRRNQSQLRPGCDYVVNLKHPAIEAPWESFTRDLTYLLRRVHAEMDKTPEPPVPSSMRATLAPGEREA